ncbi:uncharacterized protein LOC144437378 [Glandiceps talaboti]
MSATEETAGNPKRTKTVDRRSVLFVNDEWGATKGGMSTVHRAIATLAQEWGLDVHVTAVRASEDDIADTKEKGIGLILPETKKHYSIEPTKDWLALHASYFPNLRSQIPNLYVIVGHGSITDNIVIGWKEEVFQESKVVLFYHDIPEDVDVFKDDWTPAEVERRESGLLEAAMKAHVVFSIGPRMKSHFDNKFRAIPDDLLPKHIEYLPRPDQKFFDLKLTEPGSNDKFPWRVIVFGRVKGKERLRGYDLVAEAMAKVTASFRFVQRDAPKLVIRGIEKDDDDASKQFFEKYKKSGHLQMVMLPYGTQDDILKDLQQSHLCIMASRSEPFGMVAFEAMATGIPTLVTVNSGVAEFLKADAECSYYARSVTVNVGFGDVSRKEDVTKWEDAIRDVLCDYSVSFRRAQNLKTELMHSKAIRKSRENFKRILTR